MRTIHLHKKIIFFILLYLCAWLVLGTFLFLYYSAEYNNILTVLKEREKSSVQLKLTIIKSSLVHISNDLMFLAQQNEIQEFTSTEKKSAFQAMQREFLMQATNKALFDQIRFIDINGFEKIRVNYRDNNANITPEKDLQDKSKRYYFKNSISLSPGHIYISPLDLNVEQGKVEIPFKPMLRFATPCFDKHDKRLGIIVLNFLASHLLDKIAETSEKGRSESMLLNANGYWLLHPDSDKEWGFMFSDKKDVTFDKSYPEAWARMQKTDKGQFETPNGLFTFARIYPPSEIAHDTFFHNHPQVDSSRQAPIVHCEHIHKYYWIVLAYVSSANLAKSTRPLSHNFLLFGTGLLLFSGLATWFLASSIVNKRAFQAKMAHMAQFDSLTGLPNRALFFDRLETALSHARRYNKKVGLLYVDLNKFKAVNDTYGHHTGDELLRAVARILEQSVRQSDTLARLGGDEFAAIVHETENTQDLEKVGNKIIAALSSPIKLSTTIVQIGASVGGAIFPDHASSMTDLIHLADEAMYASKKMKHSACVVTA